MGRNRRLTKRKGRARRWARPDLCDARHPRRASGASVAFPRAPAASGPAV